MKTPKTLAELTQEFGKLHTQKSSIDGRMKKLRAQFFERITFTESQLSRQTIYAIGDPDRYVAVNYPGWRIRSQSKVHGEWRLIIEEDPAFKKYEYINPEDGKVYQRQVSVSSPKLDLDALKEADPDLHERVTYQPPRDLKPTDEIDEADRDQLMEYLDPPEVSLKMAAPRKAKPEELETLR